MAAIASKISLPLTEEMLRSLSSFGLLATLGITLTGFERGEMNGFFEIDQIHQAPNGYLHAGSILSLADTLCGIGCQLSLPQGAESFVTVEAKSNFSPQLLAG